MKNHVAVIGGGIAGLGAAYTLKKKGIPSTVFESAATAGGRMTTVPIGDYHVDIGASYVIRYFRAITELAAELGMKEELSTISVHRCSIYRDRTFHAVNLSNYLSMLMFSGVRLKGKMSLLGMLGPLLKNYTKINDFLDPYKGVGLDDGESAYDYALRKTSAEITDYLLEPLNRALCQYSVRELSRLNLMIYFLMLKDMKLQTLRDGIGSIPKKIAASLDVRYDTKVLSVKQKGDRVEVAWETNGKRETGDFAAAVVALWGDRVPSVVYGLTDAEASVLSDTRYSATTPVVFLLDRPVGVPFQSSYLAPGVSDIMAAYAIEENKGNLGVPAGKGCLFSLTREEFARSFKGSRDELGDIILGETLRLFPQIRGHVTGIHAYRWDRAVEKFQPGRMRRLHELKMNWPKERRIALAGSYLLAPTTDGAYTTGLRAADEIAGKL